MSAPYPLWMSQLTLALFIGGAMACAVGLWWTWPRQAKVEGRAAK